MSQARQSIERGLDLFRQLVAENDALEAEFGASQAEFFSAAAGADTGAVGEPDAETRSLAARRHREWFLLERPSLHLEGVPVVILQDAWFERAGPAEREIAEAFLQSLAGAFEVTSSEPGRGVWVSDLFLPGEIPIEEREAAPELQPGDLLVGRIFPIGEGVFRLSPAVAAFHDPSQVTAVRGDLQHMRASRRGVLRVQQLELERLFFTSNAAAGPEPQHAHADENRETPAAAATRIHADLVAAGITPEDAAAVIETLRDAPRTPGLVTEILNQLAFETEVDLERTRRALVELWSNQDLARSGNASPSRDNAVEEDAAGDARTALTEFDQGRAAGQSLEQLFGELAANLGVEAPEDDDEDAAPPEFPGVVGAMVEEFLWDVARQKGEPTAARFAVLRRFSEYGKELGVFENIGRRELIDFAGRWLLDEGRVESTEEARALFDALEEFCSWSREQHHHELLPQGESGLERLRRDVPRLLLLRQRIQRAEQPKPDPQTVTPFRVLAVNGARCQLAATSGGDREAVLPEEIRDLLQAGDVIHARVDDEGVLHPSSVYPSELESLLDPD